MATVYERVSLGGKRYLAGRVGYTKVLVFETSKLSDESAPIWRLVVAEGPHVPEQAAAQARELEEERAAR